MNQDEIKTTETYELYQKGVNYNRQVGLYDDTDKNFRMYNGDQWHGAKLGGIEAITYNIIKPIVKTKVGTINSNQWAIVYSGDNMDSQDERIMSNKICDALTKRAARVWERDGMDYKIRVLTKQSCINSESILYMRMDDETKDPTNEIISKTDVCYGNENSSDIQEQPYIIIKTRKPVSVLRDMAADEGVSEDKLQYIIGDNDTWEQAGEMAKKEVNDMCTFLTKMYKKDGTVHYQTSTKYVDIQSDKDTGLKRYPLAHFLWEEVEGYSRGIGEVKYIIPNQLEVNKTAMRRAVAVKQTAYPQKIMNLDDVVNPNAANEIGAVIKVRGKSTDDVKKAFTTTTPAAMSGDASLLQNELISQTKDLAGAGDVATGNFDPSTASGKAILAVQEAANMPLNEQVESLKHFIENIGLIWLEMWRVYSEDELTYVDKEIDPVTNDTVEVIKAISPMALENLQTAVKIDITPKSPFERYAQELSLENLFTAGQITLEEYVSALPNDSVMPKSKLEDIIQRRKDAQDRIAEIEAQASDLETQYNNILDAEQEVANIEPGAAVNEEIFPQEEEQPYTQGTNEITPDRELPLIKQ